MIKPQLEGVLAVSDKNDALIAIVHNDTKTHNQIFYKVEKMGAEEIKELLEKTND